MTRLTEKESRLLHTIERMIAHWVDGTIVEQLEELRDEILDRKIESEKQPESEKLFIASGWFTCKPGMLNPDLRLIPGTNVLSGMFLVSTDRGVLIDQFVLPPGYTGYWLSGADVKAWRPLPKPFQG